MSNHLINPVLQKTQPKMYDEPLIQKHIHVKTFNLSNFKN